MVHKLGSILVLSSALFGVASAGEITIISFGRADQAALTKAYFRPFQEATGINVKSASYDGQTTELEMMTKADRTVWDVIQVESRTLERGCRNGLFEKLDTAKIENTDDFIPGALTPCGVGVFAWSLALAFDPAKVKQAPTSWADFWDVQKIPGKRGLRRSAKYTLEIALLADGVAPADVYRILSTKQGVDRAFKKLDQIKGSTIWWQAAAQPAAFLGAGTLVMTSAYTVWLDRAQTQARPFKIAWTGSLYDFDSWAIPKGTPNSADAYRFINFASKPEHQKIVSESLAYGPSVKSALPLLDPQVARAVPSAEANLGGALKVDTDFWIRNGEALEKRFDAWAPKICVQQTDDDDDDYTDQGSCQDNRGNLRPRNGSAAKSGHDKAHSHDHPMTATDEK